MNMVVSSKGVERKMETTWLAIVVSVLITVILSVSGSWSWMKKKRSGNHISLPPGPPHIPIITSIVWLKNSFADLEPALLSLVAKYGPIITLRIASRPSIFICDRSLAHHALIHQGAFFSSRPPALPVSKLVSSNQHNISSASYGPTWRTLRRNLTSEILHPARVKSFSPFRKSALHLLLTRLNSDSRSSPVRIIDHLHYAMFFLLVSMCFGQRLDDKQIKDVERVTRNLLLGFRRFNILNFWPAVTRILFRKRWQELLQVRKDQEDVLGTLIRARNQAKEHRLSNGNINPDDDDDGCVVSYVDTLLDLELQEEKRKLDEGEMVTLCSEFLNAGTDTTSTSLQWIMANVVKYPHIQQRLVEEIREVIGEENKEVREEDLHKLPYLKAVVLEGLRRHPPGHFVLPHAVTEDVVLNGHLVPKSGTVNFMVAQIGWDPQVWEDPMAFKPERFLQLDNQELEAFDITGTKEIKMMPFGAGRRICPGYNLAMLHLEYFVANLVWNFDWKVPEGGSVDLSEKQEFTVVMKNPLQAHLTPRSFDV